jgi:Cu2+-containing amine oxidase
MTNAAPLMLATPSSLLQKRGGFSLKNIWVTPHSESERWPAGEYTIQSKGGEGLPLWTKQVSRVPLSPSLMLVTGTRQYWFCCAR